MSTEEAVATIDEVLATPDPNPDMLPAIPPGFALQEQTAQHLVRAILKAGAVVGSLEAQRDADLLAWNQMIQRVKDREASWRSCIRDWMLRNGITQLKSPWFTASIAKAREKLVWDDEDKVIGILDAMGATEAIQIRRTVKKKEFAPIYNATPSKFEGVVTADQGEPQLRILRRDT